MITVVAGIIVKGGKVLIARRASHKSLSGKWEFPGGKTEGNETPETALERELFEEFNVITLTGRFITKNKHDYGDFQIELLVYESKVLEGDFKLTDHDKIEWVDKNELQQYDLAEADIPIIIKLKEWKTDF